MDGITGQKHAREWPAEGHFVGSGSAPTVPPCARSSQPSSCILWLTPVIYSLNFCAKRRSKPSDRGPSGYYTMEELGYLNAFCRLEPLAATSN